MTESVVFKMIKKVLTRLETKIAALKKVINLDVFLPEADTGGITQAGEETESKEGEEESVIKVDVLLPEADIDGLHFNEQKVHAIFEKSRDGWYYSRDILFLSARNVIDDSSHDILSEYLSSEEFRSAILDALAASDSARLRERVQTTIEDIKVILPKKDKGIKRYHGVTCWYWTGIVEKLSARASVAYFCAVASNGTTGKYNAAAVGGCAPAFCIESY